MTEVPEHLLRRSQERRAALGLGGGDAPSAPAPVIDAEPEAPSEVYIKLDAVRRNRVPMWVMPVLVALPFYGFLYAGAFGERAHDEPLTGVELGREVYRTAGCSGCHGGAGEGGAGPALAAGEVELTFPEAAEHVAFVKSGSAPFKGQPYGDPDREGGARIAETGQMPAFGGSLSDEEIEAVVAYERDEL